MKNYWRCYNGSYNDRSIRWNGYGFERKNGGRAYQRRFPTEREAAVAYNKSLDDAVRESQIPQEKADKKYNRDDEGNKLM